MLNEPFDFVIDEEPFADESNIFELPPIDDIPIEELHVVEPVETESLVDETSVVESVDKLSQAEQTSFDEPAIDESPVIEPIDESTVCESKLYQDTQTELPEVEAPNHSCTEAPDHSRTNVPGQSRPVIEKSNTIDIDKEIDSYKRKVKSHEPYIIIDANELFNQRMLIYIKSALLSIYDKNLDIYAEKGGKKYKIGCADYTPSNLIKVFKYFDKLKLKVNGVEKQYEGIAEIVKDGCFNYLHSDN